MTREQIHNTASQVAHPLFYRVVFAGSTSSSFRAAFPDLEQRSVPDTVPSADSKSVSNTVLTDVVKGAPMNELAPLIMTSDRDHTVLEGPVLDAAQLAGIVSDICHRNGKIIRVELMTSEWEA